MGTIAGGRGCFRPSALDTTIPGIQVSDNGISAPYALILKDASPHGGESRLLHYQITNPKRGQENGRIGQGREKRAPCNWAGLAGRMTNAFRV